eukprot:444488-Pelagomonas_calceolata.AAC.1
MLGTFDEQCTAAYGSYTFISNTHHEAMLHLLPCSTLKFASKFNGVLVAKSQLLQGLQGKRPQSRRLTASLFIMAKL